MANILATKVRHVIPGLVPLFLLTIFCVSFWAYSPEGVIAFLGVENAYVSILVLAFIGGLSTFSGVPYHLVLVSLAAGGLDPWLLGTLAALGVMAGDSTSYWLGSQGRVLLSARMRLSLERMTRVRERHPRLLPLAFLAYGSCMPFSNDVITIPAGLMKYPFWQVMGPLALGNLIFNVSLALVSAHARDWLEWLPFL